MTNQIEGFYVGSNLPDVKPKNISLFLRANMRTVEIPPDQRCLYYAIPLSSDYLAENADIVFPSRHMLYVEDCGMPRPTLSGHISKW